MAKYWRYIELGEIADALLAYGLHPVRTMKAKLRQRKADAEKSAQFNAEIDRYMLVNPGMSREIAVFGLYFERQNAMLRGLTIPTDWGSAIGR